MSSVLQGRATPYEIERGKPMPSFNHGSIQANLVLELGKNPRFRVISELTLEFDGPAHAVPDLCIYERRPLDLVHDQIRASEPPLLVVEILSPTQGTYEIMQRLDRYFANGVKSCWIVEPTSHTITLRTADGAEVVAHDGEVTDPVVGISANLSAVFS
jgi:Uma2 family endonuclease